MIKFKLSEVEVTRVYCIYRASTVVREFDSVTNFVYGHCLGKLIARNHIVPLSSEERVCYLSTIHDDRI